MAAIILAFVAAVPGVLAFINQRRKDTNTAAMGLINEFQETIDGLKGDIAAERKARKELEAEFNVERKVRIAAEEKVSDLARQLHFATQALREATEARNDRIRRINELEDEVGLLRNRVLELEAK